MQRKVKIKLDKVRHLKYTWGALRFLKDEYGLTVGSLENLTNDWTMLGPWVLAGLRWEDEDLTLEKVEENLPLTPETFNEIVGKIVDGLGLAQESDVPVDPQMTTPTTMTGVNSIG